MYIYTHKEIYNVVYNIYRLKKKRILRLKIKKEFVFYFCILQQQMKRWYDHITQYLHRKASHIQNLCLAAKKKSFTTSSFFPKNRNLCTNDKRTKKKKQKNNKLKDNYH